MEWIKGMLWTQSTLTSKKRSINSTTGSYYGNSHNYQHRSQSCNSFKQVHVHSFVTNRKYFLTINGQRHSVPIISNCGVPQGSHIGPLLYVTFCYDVAEKIKFAKILQYADDTKLVMNVSKEIDRIRFQLEINEFTK